MDDSSARRMEVPEFSDSIWFHELHATRPGFAVHGTVWTLVLLLVAALVWANSSRLDIVVEAHGRVRGRESPRAPLTAATGEPVSAAVAGKVLEVACTAGAPVQQDDVLVRLDSALLDEQMAALERRRSAACDKLRLLEQQRDLVSLESEAIRERIGAELDREEERLGLERARQEARVQLAQFRTDRVLRREEELSRLAAEGIVSDLEYQEARADLAEARAELELARVEVDGGRATVLKSELRLEERQVRRRLEELETLISAQRGEVEVLAGELDEYALQRDSMVVRAPKDGIVTSCVAVRGTWVEPGDVFLWLCPGDGLRFDGLVATRDARGLAVGMRAKVRIDAFDPQEYEPVAGVVEYVAPDSQLDARGILTYLVSVRLEEPPTAREGASERIRIGMSGVAEIVTDRDRVLTWVARKLLPQRGAR